MQIGDEIMCIETFRTDFDCSIGKGTIHTITDDCYTSDYNIDVRYVDNIIVLQPRHITITIDQYNMYFRSAPDLIRRKANKMLNKLCK